MSLSIIRTRTAVQTASPTQAGASDLAEGARADRQPREIERRCISGIVHLPAELEALVLADPDILEQREIKVGQAWRGQDIPARGTIVAGCDLEAEVSNQRCSDR
jgi:hypothetical protein